MADMDLSFTSGVLSQDLDHPELKDSKFYRFSVIRIYSCKYNESTRLPEYSFENDSYNIPVSMGSYLGLTTENKIDRIYFKPDGSIACDANKIFFCSPNNTAQYYVLDINKSTGTFVSRSYKE